MAWATYFFLSPAFVALGGSFPRLALGEHFRLGAATAVGAPATAASSADRRRHHHDRLIRVVQDAHALGHHQVLDGERRR